MKNTGGFSFQYYLTDDREDTLFVLRKDCLLSLNLVTCKSMSLYRSDYRLIDVIIYDFEQ